MKQLFKPPQLIRWILWIGFIFLMLMSLMRVGLYAFLNKEGYSFLDLGDSFILGLRYDLRVVAILLLIMLILGSVKLLDPFQKKAGRKFWFVFLSVVTVFILFFYVIDFLHYSYVKQRLNASALNYLHDAGISINMVWQSYPVIKLILGITIITILVTLLIRVSYRSIRNNYPVSKRARIISFIVCFCLLGFFIFGRFNQYPLRWSDAFALGSDYKASLALNPFQSFFSTLKFRSNNYDDQKVRELYPVIARHFGLNPSSEKAMNFERVIVPARRNTIAAPNVILILCESFSAYKSSMWGNPLNTTPFFNSMCRNGIFFDYCFTPTYGTAKGVWATITGIPDVSEHSTATRNPSAVDQHVIINNFVGHKKFYFIGGSTSWANLRGVLTNNINDLNLYEQDNFNAPKIDVWGISDKNLLLESNKVLASQNQPFFAIIQTAGNHRPYTIPEEDLKEFKKVEVHPDSLKKYGFESLPELNAFRYTDYFTQKFMEAAGKEKYFDNTIFVFIGDHGIVGNAGDMFPKAWTNQRLTVEHVPLLFYAPKLFPARRISKICSQIDVLPTTAGLCNISYVNTTLGQDLLDTATKSNFAFIFDPDYQQTGIIKEKYSYRKNIETGKEELVSLVDNEDPALHPDFKNIIAELRGLNEAIHETAKYLLLNNKKKTIPGSR